MDFHPLVTVVIPTRNRSDRIREAVKTVLDQTWRRLEVVVVDDASDDRTAEVVDSLRGEDSRVRSVRHSRRKGAAAARNTGVREGSGSLLAFNDDDCTWSPRKLERQVDALEGGHGIVAYCPMRLRLSSGGERIVAVPDAERDALEALLKRSFIPTPTALVPRELFREVGGFDEDLPALQDWDLVLRLAPLSRFRFVPDVEVRSDYLEGGISDRAPTVTIACVRVRAKLLDTGLSRESRSHLHTALGHTLMMSGDPGLAQKMFGRALREAPTAVRPWILGGLALLGRGTYRGLIRWRERLQGSAVDRLVDRFWRA